MATSTVVEGLEAGDLLSVLRAFRQGDFSRRMSLKLTGTAGEIAESLNDAIERAALLDQELARIRNAVGQEGKISQRASLDGARGSWASCIDSVNGLISDLVQPSIEVGRVLASVARGDLSQKMALETDGAMLKGEFLKTARTVNGMVDQLASFTSEVIRVAREVGTEGKLGGQARVKGVAGTWKDLTDSVNFMASNLTGQVRNIAEVTTAVAKGDLSKKITVDVKGEILELKDTINTMVDQLSSFAAEVTRVAKEVGTEGKLGGQAKVEGVSGTWRDLTDSVNSMASNLTSQVRNIAAVTKAVARGDLSKQITVDVKGEILDLKNTINTMVDQLSSFASEVTRVAREVGTEGKLGGQARVEGVSGTWKDLTDSVNFMASNLTGQVRNIAEVTKAVANGDLSTKITVDVKGEILDLKATINKMVDQLRSFASEVTRVAREVGTEGKLGGQAEVPGVSGTWKDLTDSVNSMASNLTGQVRNIADVTTAVAKGDLSRKITVDVKGEILELKNTINTMVDQLSSFAAEVTRVAREVGSEGKLGGQADVRGVSGTWRDLTDSVNFMASNLTGQVRNIADVTTAVAKGDLSKKITVDVKGEILELKDTINTMVDQLRSFASEVTRVAREVGTEGKLGGQAEVTGVSGTWKDLTDSVNSMASNLTAQVRNIAEVSTAVATGDLSKKITVDVKGEILELKDTINTMVDQLRSFASEVTRVAREVGSEGKLGGQAKVEGVSGTWKDLTDSVNFMAGNLTDQVRNIAAVTKAVASGDLSKQITVDVKGEILELKNTINTMVEQLSSFAAEVTRVAREVGSEGQLGGQADVRGVSGTWRDLTDSVNFMASNLTGQVRNIAEVTTAVANGDLSKKITVDVKGEILELKNTINTMVDQLRSFASEVTRVAREVGTEGKLGGQAQVPGVSGTWKDLTDSVNFMAGNLTAQVRNIAEVSTAVANGDLSRKITVDVRGEILELKNTINTMVDQLRRFASEVTRVAREVGSEGKLGGQARVEGVSGTWKDLTDSVNFMASNLTDQVRNIAEVTTAVANGDLSKQITVDVKGEILALKNTINRMVDQLGSFASEVTRVAREVGTEGKLGGQAQVKGVAGIWKELTENLNAMASNLTSQVRGIAKVVTSVANGDLKQKMMVEAKGEIAALADTINNMTDTLATFAEQVTTVAREVGVEGKLGGQARVPGAAGTWRDLTDNVNQLAANLTTQVRDIAEVATAVTKGDLTRSITIEAQGEVAFLKDTINEMIRNLKDTTRKNTEQDWLKTNLAKFTRMLQGEKDLVAVSRLILSELASTVGARHGVFYIADGSGDDLRLRLMASWAYQERKHLAKEFKLGEGLVGQCAFEKQRILLTEVPDDYVKISSGLGEGSPLNIIVLPVLFEGQVRAVIELASFRAFSDVHQAFLDQLTESIGIVLNTIQANMRTEALLKQSQSLAQELQTGQQELQETNARLGRQAATLRESEEKLRQQQEELTQTNEELEDKAHLLEAKNREVEVAKRDLEEKAEQLSLTSRYKSQFLANMSHELRTPLNSLLILAKLLADNPDANLTDKQVEFARTIHEAGRDLLSLINNILDLSKIESGTVELDIDDVDIGETVDDLARVFKPLAEDKGLDFRIDVEADVPKRIRTDGKRLAQILRNLLANAIKFTEAGNVRLEVALHDRARLMGGADKGEKVLAFAVKDSGIGIPKDKQQVIFEAFQQAEGSTSRKFGGTGLGLTISREIARLLGGEIRVESEVGKGSVFTLYLPQSYAGPSTVIPPSATEVRFGPVTFGPPIAEASKVEGEAAVDDRSAIGPGDRYCLIVEDDPAFARVLVEASHDLGLKALVTRTGDGALAATSKILPTIILLDILLPGVDGWTVLDRLKHDPATRHVPVIVQTVVDNWERAFGFGAFSAMQKPIDRDELMGTLSRALDLATRQTRRLLIVAPSEGDAARVESAVGGGRVEATHVSTLEDLDPALGGPPFDCVVVDQRASDAGALKVVEAVRRKAGEALPIVMCPEPGIEAGDLALLRRMATLVVDPASDDLLVDRTSLFLHVPEDAMPDAQRNLMRVLRRRDPQLAGRKVLVVDDDIRNVFAITSVLERHRVEVIRADNGLEGVARLEAHPDVDVVLMDLMMPDMDGYEATRRIRAKPEHRQLPIIALTAKAMLGERERCIEAGMSDYLAKPVEDEVLLSTLRVWLGRQRAGVSRA